MKIKEEKSTHYGPSPGKHERVAIAFVAMIFVSPFVIAALYTFFDR